MTKRVLMCEPVNYRIEYEINPWMRRSNTVDSKRALDQWRGLYEVLGRLGVEVELIEQGPDVPDMTFTANAGVVSGRSFVPASFRFSQRYPEAPRFVKWFEEKGYRIRRLAGSWCWEGEGDVLFAGPGRAVAAYGPRTDEGALDDLEEVLSVFATRVELIDPRFYHLDTCFAALDERLAIYYPEALSEASVDALSRRFEGLVPVPKQDALRFACNAVVVDRRVMLNAGCAETVRELGRLEFEAIEVPMDEFIKSGGSAKCLVLTLDRFGSADREEAA